MLNSFKKIKKNDFYQDILYLLKNSSVDNKPVLLILLRWFLLKS